MIIYLWLSVALILGESSSSYNSPTDQQRRRGFWRTENTENQVKEFGNGNILFKECFDSNNV